MWNVITAALLLVMIFILYAIKKSRADNPFILAFAGVILLIVTYLFSKNAGELWLHTNASASTSLIPPPPQCASSDGGSVLPLW